MGPARLPLGCHGRRKAQLRGFRMISAFLRELDGGDRPLSIVSSDRNSQAVPFVKQNRLHGPGLSVREDYGLADKLGLGLLKLAEDRGRTLPNWHLVLLESRAFNGRCLHLKGGQVVAGARQPGVAGGRAHSEHDKTQCAMGRQPTILRA
jgi:hypothetical protein